MKSYWRLEAVAALFAITSGALLWWVDWRIMVGVACNYVAVAIWDENQKRHPEIFCAKEEK